MVSRNGVLENRIVLDSLLGAVDVLKEYRYEVDLFFKYAQESKEYKPGDIDLILYGSSEEQFREKSLSISTRQMDSDELNGIPGVNVRVELKNLNTGNTFSCLIKMGMTNTDIVEVYDGEELKSKYPSDHEFIWRIVRTIVKAMNREAEALSVRWSLLSKLLKHYGKEDGLKAFSVLRESLNTYTSLRRDLRNGENKSEYLVSVNEIQNVLEEAQKEIADMEALDKINARKLRLDYNRVIDGLERAQYEALYQYPRM